MQTRFRRLIVGALTTMTAVTGMFAVSAPAHAASAIGGPINRSEILARAHEWLNRTAIHYSQEQSDAYPDSSGHTYRPDCSGYVAMAWHLDRYPGTSLDYYTENLPQVSTQIAKDDLRPGDMLLRRDSGNDDAHATIFNGWRDAGHKDYNVMELGAAAVGHEPSNTSYPHEAWYTWDTAYNSGFRPYRYNKVVEDTALTMPRTGSPVVHNPLNGHMEVYYKSGSSVGESWWQPSGWTQGTVGSAISEGRPVAVFNPVSNNVEVYYNAGGRLAEVWYTPDGVWHTNAALAGSQMSGSPAVVFNAGQRTMEIYFNDGGQLKEAWWHDGTWNTGVVGGAITGSPAAVFDEGNNAVEVYFNGGGLLTERYWRPGASWATTNLNVGMGTAASPSALYNSNNRNVEVYYGDQSGRLTEDYWNAGNGTWSGARNLGGTISQGDPVAVLDPATAAVEVYYNSGGKLTETYYGGGAWHGPATVGGSGAQEQMAGSPMAAFNYTNSALEVYFGSGGSLAEYYHTSSGWSALTAPGGQLS
jgi:YD repeat-containing protein